MRNFILAALFVASAAVANAGSILVEQAPTVGVPGSTTYTFIYDAGDGEAFRGFDATFSGNIGQVNPLAMATPFNDLNGFFGADDVSADSQFLFNSGDVLSINVDESGTLLTGAISGLAALSLPDPLPFAQIASTDPVQVNVDIDVDNGSGLDENFSGTISSFLIPEPATALLAGLALVGFAARRQ